MYYMTFSDHSASTKQISTFDTKRNSSTIRVCALKHIYTFHTLSNAIKVHPEFCSILINNCTTVCAQMLFHTDFSRWKYWPALRRRTVVDGRCVANVNSISAKRANDVIHTMLQTAPTLAAVRGGCQNILLFSHWSICVDGSS